jgi:hypothetical protein
MPEVTTAIIARGYEVVKEEKSLEAGEEASTNHER